MRDDGYIDLEKGDKLVLPSQLDDTRVKKKKRPLSPAKIEKRKKYFKWTLIGLLALTVYVFYDSIVLYLMGLLKTHPTVYQYYLFIESEIKNNTIRGLLFISVLGSLFFLVLPSEAVFIYYLSQTDYNPGTIMILTILGTLIGFTFNYSFGRILGERVVRFLFKKNFENYKEKIQKYGGYVLLVGAILPGPIEALAVFYGCFKFGYWRYIYLVFIGRFIKYSILLLAFMFFWEEIMFYYTGIIENVIILKGLFL